MRVRALFASIAAAAVLAAAATAGTTAPASGAVVREFKGTILSVKRSNRSFLMHDLRRGTNFRIYVRKRTVYTRGLKSYKSLRKDVDIEVRAVRSEGHRLLARSIEGD
jgi:hypothetical protein